MLQAKLNSVSHKRNRKLTWSPLKRSPAKSPQKKKRREGPWSAKEIRSLIEFVALHKDIQSTENEWPSMRPEHTYWEKAYEYVKRLTGCTRSGKIFSFSNYQKFPTYDNLLIVITSGR